MKMIIGILLGFAIGIGCRWFDIPVPSPPKLIGAVLVVAMTSGYILTDKWMQKRENKQTNTLRKPIFRLDNSSYN